MRRIWYHFCRSVCSLVVRMLFCVRVYRRERICPAGPMILVANHQSHLDPILIGVASRRPLNFLARKTLFRGGFGFLIRSLDAIPVDREGVSLGALREIVRRLKSGQATLVFPEGTRTHDGKLGPLQAGFSVLVRRAGATMVPIGIDGAFQAWPRQRKLPRLGRVVLYVGRPIPAAEIAGMSDEQLVGLLAKRLQACVRTARSLRGSAEEEKYGQSPVRTTL